MFAVVPKLDCPHIGVDSNLQGVISDSLEEFTLSISNPCENCRDLSENWICLACRNNYCSRYVFGHAAEHYEQSRHPLSLSISDLSVWCYECVS